MQLQFKYKFLGQWRTTANIDSKCCTIINLIMLDIFNNNFTKSEINDLLYFSEHDYYNILLFIENPQIKIDLLI